MSYFPSINLQKVLGATHSNTNPVFAQVVDAAGNARGLNVDANGKIAITVSSIPSHDVTNAGTFAVQVSTALPTGTNSIGKISDITTSVTPGTGAANLGKAWISGAPASGDTGVALLGNVTTNPNASPINTANQWGIVNIDTTGKLWTAGSFLEGVSFASASSRHVQIGARYDDTTPTAASEDTTGYLRMSSRRELYVQIRDAAGNERGLSVDTNGAIAITVASIPSHAVTNAGTFVVQENGALLTSSQLIDDMIASSGDALSKFAVYGAQFDDVSPGAMTEDKVGPLRMSSRRELYTQIRDAAGNERGLNVDANGKIGVTRVPSPTVITSGSLDPTVLNSAVTFGMTPGYGENWIEFDPNNCTNAATYTIEGTIDGSTWFSLSAAENGTLASASTFSINSGSSQRRTRIMQYGSVLQNIRVRVSTISSDTGPKSGTVRLVQAEMMDWGSISGVVPGTSSTSLGKSEDAAHGSGDVGLFMLTVRNDTYQTRASADGDYNAPATNAGGAVMTALAGGQIPTYSAAISEFALAATPTYIFSIYGSASKTIRITRIRVVLIETAETIRNIKIEKLSSALTGGTSAAMTAVPHDSNSAAATATPLNWTANKTGGGTLVGSIDEINITSTLVSGTASAASKSAPAATVYNWWGDSVSSPIILRGTAQGIGLNLSGQALDAGRKASVYVEWVEDAT